MEIYPHLLIREGPQGLLLCPNVLLPKNYRELVKPFYERKGKEVIEEHAKRLARATPSSFGERIEIALQWDDEEGLTHIGIGTEGGFYLQESGEFPDFIMHNLGGRNSIPAYLVANRYVAELLQKRRE